MLGAVEMLGGVLVFGGVAASDVAALHAQTKMHPGVAHFQALFAALGVWRYLVNVTQIRASAHDLPIPNLEYTRRPSSVWRGPGPRYGRNDTVLNARAVTNSARAGLLLP